MEQQINQHNQEKIMEQTDSEDFKKSEIYQKIINNKVTSEKIKSTIVIVLEN